MAVAAYNTIYDVIVGNAGLYSGTHKVSPGLSSLYNDVSQLLGIFALADLRHDFGRGADIFIVSAKKTIGQIFCELVAAAFYAPTSARYNDLLTYLRDTYDKEITSNDAAIKFFKSEMDNFFLNRMSAYKGAFTPGAYARYYDSCAQDTMDYDTPAKLNHILTVISPAANRANQAIFVDAQMGNPMEKLFNGGAAGARPAYLHNFASTMDAAPKPTANVHTYMNTFVQANPTVPNILPAYTYVGAQINIVGFGQIAGTWTTTVDVTSNGKTVRETFSVLHKASVNNMGLMLVRGKGAAGGAAGKVGGAVDVFEILVQHLFKSLGDRLQDWSVSAAGLPLIYYMQVADIKSGVPAGGAAARTAADKNVLVFTNDEMNNYQLYMMGINSVYTGFGTVTPYANRTTVALKAADVRHFFADRAAAMHAALKAAPAPILIVNTPDLLRLTLHESLTRSHVQNTISTNPLLKLLSDKVADAGSINKVVTDGTFGSYTNIMTDNIVNYLRRACMPKEMSTKFIKSTLAKYFDEAASLNRDATWERLGGAAFADLYLRWFTIVNGLTEFFKTVGIRHVMAYLAANGLLTRFRNIRDNMYTNGKLIGRLAEGIRADILATIMGYAITPTVLAEHQKYIDARIHETPAIAAESDKYLSILCLRIVISTDYEQLMKKAFTTLNAVVVSNEDMAAALATALPPEEEAMAPPPPPAPLTKKKTMTKVRLKTKIKTKSLKSKKTQKTQKPIASRKTLKLTKADKTQVAEKQKLIKFRESGRVARKAMLNKKRQAGKTFGDYHPRADHIRALLTVPEIDGTIEAYSEAGSDTPFGFIWRPISAIREAYDAFTRFLTGMAGGGTKTRERESKLAELCVLKLNCMAMNIKTNPVYAADLLAGSDLITTIMDDMKAISTSKSRPVLLKSSLSRIEEEEDGTQSGGGGSRTQTLTVIQPQKSHMVLHLKASKSAPTMTLASGTKVEILSGSQAKSLLEQRLAAFLWLGFNRSRESLRLEAEVSANLIGIDEFTGDAHYDLFWSQLFEFAQQPYEFFAQKYEKGLSTHFAGQSRSPLKRAAAKARQNIVRAAATRRHTKHT